MAEYTPSEARVCIDYCNAVVARRRADPLIGMAEADAEFDRFVARVRRDAAREALDGYADDLDALVAPFRHPEGDRIRHWGDTHYPETEDKP